MSYLKLGNGCCANMDALLSNEKFLKIDNPIYKKIFIFNQEEQTKKEENKENFTCCDKTKKINPPRL